MTRRDRIVCGDQMPWCPRDEGINDIIGCRAARQPRACPHCQGHTRIRHDARSVRRRIRPHQLPTRANVDTCRLCGLSQASCSRPPS
ncbi:Uncharacterised protein [Mycobacteroides abscessus subsp. abscessus]|nr:Uncharacterised protein [Mycobacteroides abscessus subsp. abscessus]